MVSYFYPNISMIEYVCFIKYIGQGIFIIKSFWSLKKINTYHHILNAQKVGPREVIRFSQGYKHKDTKGMGLSHWALLSELAKSLYFSLDFSVSKWPLLFTIYKCSSKTHSFFFVHHFVNSRLIVKVPRRTIYSHKTIIVDGNFCPNKSHGCSVPNIYTESCVNYELFGLLLRLISNKLSLLKLTYNFYLCLAM